MQALHQENVSFCRLRRYFTQINKWDAVYIGPQFGLKISGGGGGGGGWVGGGPVRVSPLDLPLLWLFIMNRFSYYV